MLALISALLLAAQQLPCGDFAKVEVTTNGIAERFGTSGQPPKPLPPPPPPKPTNYDTMAVFIGELVGSKDVRDYPRDPGELTFVVEKRWHGPSDDTVFVRARTCGSFLPGRSYLMVVGWDSTEIFFHAADHVAVEINSEPPHLTAYADSIIKSFGEPRWTAPPPGSRWYDKPISYDAGPRYVSLFVATESTPDNSTIELVGTGRTETVRQSSHVYFKRLTSGQFYRLRLRLPDGRSEDRYVLPRCYHGESQCSDMVWLRPGSTIRGLQSDK